jgi:chromosome partitioning protein
VLHRKSLTILKRIRDSAVDPEPVRRRVRPSRFRKLLHWSGGRHLLSGKRARRPPPARGRTAPGIGCSIRSKSLIICARCLERVPGASQPIPRRSSRSATSRGRRQVDDRAASRQHFAIKGYRVLFIDCDSQASSTMMFGYRPDVDLDEEDTLYGHFHNPELLGVRKIIRKTHFQPPPDPVEPATL